jgi:hypothetical protein
MLQLEKQREMLLDQHVMCVSAFVRTFSARKVVCKIVWTRHAIKMQRAARRALRIRRCVSAYYAELRQRITDRHMQEQRDMIQAEGRSRPRVLAEEQGEFYDTAKQFRALLGPMITTVLKNVRAVEASTRQELAEHLQQAYWKLEAYFAEGVAKAHEHRTQRLKEERERRQHMMEVFWSQNVEGRGRVVAMEAKERYTLMNDRILPQVRVIHAAAARIQQQQWERDLELQRLHSLRNEELRRLRRTEERRIDGEQGLWRSAIGEDSYLADLSQWRGAPAGAYEEFMRHFCAAKLPSRLLPGGADARLHQAGTTQTTTSAASVGDVARTLFDRYRSDLLRRAEGDASVFHDPQGLRKVVIGEVGTPHATQRHHNIRSSYARVALASPNSPQLRQRVADTMNVYNSLGKRLQDDDLPLAGRTMRHPSAKKRGSSATPSSLRKPKKHELRGGESSDDEMELLKALDRERRVPSTMDAQGTLLSDRPHVNKLDNGRGQRTVRRRAEGDAFETSDEDERLTQRASPPAHHATAAASMESSSQLMRRASMLKLFSSPIRHATSHRHDARAQEQPASFLCGGFDRSMFSPSSRTNRK